MDLKSKDRENKRAVSQVRWRKAESSNFSWISSQPTRERNTKNNWNRKLFLFRLKAFFLYNFRMAEFIPVKTTVNYVKHNFLEVKQNSDTLDQKMNKAESK